MKHLSFLAICIAALLAGPVAADGHVECQMDPADIEIEDDGYELDDVICKGGKQFDIELDADLNETGRRAE